MLHISFQLNTDGLYILNYALPSLYIGLPVIDYTSVIEAINNMDLTNNRNGIYTNFIIPEMFQIHLDNFLMMERFRSYVLRGTDPYFR